MEGGGIIQLDVDRVNETRAALGEFEPLARAALDREIRAAINEIRAVASARLSGRGTNTSARGYRVERRRTGYRLRNVERGAMIVEFAGRVNPDGLTPRGRTLIQTLNATYGRPGRIAWAAWDARKEVTMGRITAAVATAERAVDRYMGRV